MKRLEKYVLREKGVITGKKNLEPLYSFKDFPVFMGCVDTPKSEDIVADMDWAIDPETGVIQLTKLVPLDVLYQSQHVDGCGPTWGQYYENFASYIISKNPGLILEIGGGQGTLADLVTGSTDQIKWVMVEPNSVHKGNEKILVIKSFFDEKFTYGGEVDTIVFSQVMEHIYDPSSFLNSIHSILKTGGLLIFAYPHLELWLKEKYTNTINFEHTMFLTDYFVDYMLKKTGFHILDKRQYEDHSFFYTVEKLESAESSVSFVNKYEEYKEIFLDFISFHEQMVKDLNKKMEETDLETYLFGAHIFSEYLIQFGLNTDKIVTILDNSPTKEGKRLYGTNFIARNPSVLKDKGPVNVILKAGIYSDEIKKDILENINDKAVFW